ncbi:helix-turn-helix domain-containing protein [Actinomadura harenae]|uniref:XRE family transcriptional regulator n=1 Tax=Actinomadura harenae TaxID=2483351 RepID=A0A3M2MC08_9ACTN|nr:helix-turn-helix transcriptional regulator [Actinomadura harenae]RMI46165.1 XRE family transcriptional regulator [Actinomadura harenae]
MTAWNEYSTGERMKILRGTDITQQALAEAAGISVATVQKVEQDRGGSVGSLMKIADALGTDVGVLLGQQAPRQAMSRAERTGARDLSLAVHDSVLAPVPDIEAPPLADLKASLALAWDQFWRGDYTGACMIAPHLIAESRAFIDTHDGQLREQGLAVLANAHHVAACVANLLGKRDLAYAALAHAERAAEQSGDVLLSAVLQSSLAWVYLRDGRIERAVKVSEETASGIQLAFSDASPERLSVFGDLMLRAAVASSRAEDRTRSTDFLSQAHAAAARLGTDANHYQTLFGPTTARKTAIEIHLAFGDIGQALGLIQDTRMPGSTPIAVRCRHQLNVALAYCEAERWDEAADTLLEVCTAAPEWVRHQALAGVVVQRIGDGSTAKLRKVTQVLGLPLLPR